MGKMPATMASFSKTWGWPLYSQTTYRAVLEQTLRPSMQPVSPPHVPSCALHEVHSFYQALSQCSAVSSLHFRDSHISASRLPSKRSLVTAVPFSIHLRHMLLLYTNFSYIICFLWASPTDFLIYWGRVTSCLPDN